MNDANESTDSEFLRLLCFAKSKTERKIRLRLKLDSRELFGDMEKRRSYCETHVKSLYNSSDYLITILLFI